VDTYPGGKNGAGVYHWLINRMPLHDRYAEPFLGHGAVLRHKRPARLSWGCDPDPRVIDRWRRRPPIPGAHIYQGDGLAFLRNNDFGPGDLVYVDPPYLYSTRSSARPIYECEFGTPAQHGELLALARVQRCMVMVSGYYSEQYAATLSDWRAEQFRTTTRGGKLAVEWVWFNFPEPDRLHDWRYLGTDYRDRERMKKMRRRWAAKLDRMPDMERAALLEALRDFQPDPPSPVLELLEPRDLATLNGKH
jgi:DNA adenine methylase